MVVALLLNHALQNLCKIKGTPVVYQISLYFSVFRPHQPGWIQ